MFKDISDALVPVLAARGLDRHVARKWVYNDLCSVVDFSYRDVRFGFNITPSPEGLVSLDIVRRAHKSRFQVTASPGGKDQLASGVALDAALGMLEAKTLQLIEAIDSHLDRPAPAAALVQAAAATAAERHPGSKKVGVLTLPLNTNFGGNLQAYAMMQVLRLLGHEPVLLNRRHPQPGAADPAATAETDADLPLISKSIAMGKATLHAPFIEKHVAPLSRRFDSSSDLRRTIGRYELDAIIVGSDQVWRPKYAKSILSDFFLGFLPEDDHRTRRISYAASFGAPNWEFDGRQTAEARRLIGRFAAVSVREDSGVALARDHLGVDAQHVLDPTLLLEPGQYATLFSARPQPSGGDRLLTYILDGNDDKAQVTEALARRLSISAYYTNGLPVGGEATSGKAGGDRSVQGWLAAFHGAAFVVTDSFHGVAFSILFNKPFIAYGNPSRGMARFTSLLKMFGLEDRLVAAADEVDIEKITRPVDWRIVNERLAKLRAASLQFLKSALSDDGDTRGTAPSRSTFAGAAPVAGAALDTAAEPSQRHPLNVLCTGCGVCVSESRGTLKMAWSEDGFLVPRATSGTVPAEAVRVCPFNPRPEKEVEDEDALGRMFLPAARNIDARAGRFENAYIGYSREFRPTSSSGGIATYVLKKVLEQREVDYLFVVRSDGGSGYQYQVVDNADNIQKISKTRYFPVTMEKLFSVIEQTEGRVAVSGVACFIKAIRLKQHYNPELKEKIPFLVGIICGGLKNRWYTDFLAQSAGIEGAYTNPEYRVKDAGSSAGDYSFAALDEESRLRQVKMRRVGDMWGTGLFKAKACDFCTDVLTELADISLGDAWLPKYKSDGMGNSVVLTRSALAETIIRSGIAAGELVLEEVPVARIVESQSGGFNHRQNAAKFRAWLADYFSAIPVPAMRARHMRQISLPDAVVQLHRERTRSKSLRYWNETRNFGSFMGKMRASLDELKVATASRRDGSGEKLTALLAKPQIRNLRQAQRGVAGRQPMLRWLMRRAQGQQVFLNLLRAALLEAKAVRLGEPKADKPQNRPS